MYFTFSVQTGEGYHSSCWYWVALSAADATSLSTSGKRHVSRKSSLSVDLLKTIITYANNAVKRILQGCKVILLTKSLCYKQHILTFIPWLWHTIGPQIEQKYIFRAVYFCSVSDRLYICSGGTYRYVKHRVVCWKISIKTTERNEHTNKSNSFINVETRQSL